MRRIKVSLHTTLDGFLAGPNGEMNWIRFDEELFDFVKTFTSQADAAMYGRVTWQMMEAYWPTAADKPNATRHDKEHSVWYRNAEKFVVSNSMQGQKKDKTTFIGGDIAHEVRSIKQGIGKDILIFGSPSLIRLLILENLIDEYWLFVNPVILGKGIPMFPETGRKIELVHRGTKDFACGVTGLNYTV